MFPYIKIALIPKWSMQYSWDTLRFNDVFCDFTKFIVVLRNRITIVDFKSNSHVAGLWNRKLLNWQMFCCIGKIFGFIDIYWTVWEAERHHHWIRYQRQDVDMGGMVVQWLALSPTKKVLGFNSMSARLCVEFACSPCVCVGSLWVVWLPSTFKKTPQNKTCRTARVSRLILHRCGWSL